MTWPNRHPKGDLSADSGIRQKSVGPLHSSSASHTTSIALVGCILFIVAWGTNVATPFLVLYRDLLDLSNAATVTIFTVYVVGILGALILAGPLSDRFGRKRVIGPSVVLSGVASLVLIAGQHNYLWLMVGRMLLGLASGATFGVGAAWLQELFGPTRSATAAIMTTLVTYGGFGIGPPVSAAFERFSDSPLTTPFILHAVLSVFALAMVAAAQETVVVDGDTRPFALRFGVPQGARRQFWTRIAPVAVWVFAFPSTAFALFPVLVSDKVPGSEVAVAAASGLLTAWAALAARPILHRCGAIRALNIGLFMGVLGYVAGTLAFATPWWGLVLPAAMLLGAASGTVTAAVLADLASMTDPESRGALNSTFYLLAYIGMGMPTIITTIGRTTGLTAALVTVTIAAAAVSAVTALRTARSGKHRSR